ncbi:MAG TPA: hypothetical protein VI298_09470 [Geobacteraceae bacterium]
MKRTQKPFTRIELPIALVIIGCIVTIPVGVFAAPVEKAGNEAAVAQIKENLRQIAEAAALWEKADGCSKSDCLDANKLVAAGKLAGAPQVPAGIGAGDPSPYYSTTEKPKGGCGPRNFGAPRTVNPILNNVSEQFCRDYNNSVGLGSTILNNCASGGDCSASGSTDPYDFPIVNSSSFCYRRSDMYTVVWMSAVSGTPCTRK